jgi:hypothetical protein
MSRELSDQSRFEPPGDRVLVDLPIVHRVMDVAVALCVTLLLATVTSMAIAIVVTLIMCASVSVVSRMW